MRTVTSIFEAYLHFQPYNPQRDSETVTINSPGKPEFLHWDKATRIFTRDDNRGNTACFQGWMIDSMGQSSRAYLEKAQKPAGVPLQ